MSLKINLIVLFILIGVSVNAQKQPAKKAQHKTTSDQQVKGLNIGDKVPDIPMNKIMAVDGSLSLARTADFNDRLLILDFMYTSCPSCISGLPKKDHLQKQFGDKIKVMVVIGGATLHPEMLQRENEAYIRKFLTNKKSFLSRNNVEIPWVVENRLLNQYFRHQLVSHLVWIYKGELVAVTEQDYVNADNIQAILDGKKNHMPVKNDFVPPIDVTTPLVSQGNRFTGKYPAKYAAVFGAYQDGMMTKIGTNVDSVHHTRRDYMINIPVLNAYSVQWNIASGSNRFLEPSGTILEVKDPSKYITTEGDKRTNFMIRQSTYICYESMGPDSGQTQQEIALQTIHNLNHLLGLKGRYEKRKIKCLVLVEKGPVDAIKSAGGNEEISAFVPPNIKLQNRNLDDIVWRINQVYGNLPAFNETKYKGNVNIDFTLDSWKNIPELRKALQHFGLDLQEEERELEVFVLTELSANN